MVTIKLSQHQIRIAIIILLCLPPLITGIYIAMFGVNVIYWDQWSFLSSTLSHWYNGSLSFQDLFAQHNEHRFFFPKIIMIGIAALTSYNNLAEMACSYFLLLLNLFLIYKIYLLGRQWSWKYLMLFIPVAWLVCSLSQYENLLLGFEINVFLCVTGVLLAILSLERCKGIDWNLAVGIFWGILSSFSFMNGLMVWPAGLVLLLLKEKRTPREICAWFIAAFVTTAVFFNGWIRPEYLPSPLYFLSSPVDAIKYFFVVTANSLGFGFSMFIVGEYIAIIGGVLVLTILSFVLYRVYNVEIIRKNASFMALIIFALLSEAMLTAGRGGFGIPQATSSRYVTLTVLGIIGTYFLFIRLMEFCKDDLWAKRVFCLFCLLIFAGIVIGLAVGLVQGEKMKQQRQEMRETLLSFQTAPDSALKMLYPDPKLVREWATFLQKYRLNVFTGNYTT